jgi:hypothetical protein
MKVNKILKSVLKNKLKQKNLKMFFPEPKNQGNVFNPSSYNCNNCCGGGDGAQGPAGPAAPTISSVAFNAINTTTTGPYNGNNVLNTVPFNSIISSTGGGFSTSTSIFTVPTTGIYQFNASVGVTNFTTTAGFYVNLQLLKNGGTAAVNSGPVLPQASNPTFTYTLNLTSAILCTAGDTLYLATYSGATGSWFLQNNFSYFSAFLTANGQIGATGPQGLSASSTVFLWDTWIYPNATATNAMTPPGTLSPGVVYSDVTGEGVVLNANSINTNRAIYWTSAINILDPTTTYTMTASCAAFGGQGPGDSYTMYIGSPNAIAGNNNGGANDGLKISIDFYNNQTYITVNTSIGSFPFFSTSGTRFIGPFATWSATVGSGLQNWFDLTAVIFTVGTQRICEVSFAGSKVASRNITNLVLSGNFLGVSAFSGAASAYIYTRSLKISRS